MEINTLVKQELISISDAEMQKENIIEYLGNILLENNYIKKEYINDVIEREKKFPTGIQLKNMGIAIPHAYPVNVLKNGIAVLKLRDKAIFESMENSDEEVDVSMIFMLALKDSDDHIKMLQNLFIMFQQENVMEDLIKADSVDKIEAIIANNLTNVV